MRTAAALIIGNELLTGKIAEQNLLVLARTLRSVGVTLRRVVMVLDDVETIVSEVRALSAAHDVLFTSGGVGPTHDDVTIAAVAQAFGVPVVTAEPMASMLRAYYGDKLTESHLLMASMPEGARLAASATVPWPAVVMSNVWVLPGVPDVFKMKMAVVREELAGEIPFVSHAVFTTLDEGQLKPMLDRVVADYADLDIGSYPLFKPEGHDPEYRTKLTFDGRDEARVLAARDAFAASLPPESIVRSD
ncbi:MAG: molybdopterin-binding protein [Polyangiaceae bacterium]